MYIERYGSGKRRFLGVHGWTGDHRTFEELTHFLTPDVSLFAADLPGCGQSREPARWDLETVARELADTIDRLAPLTLVGNCTGGLLSLRSAILLEGHGIDRIVLLDPFASWPWFMRAFRLPGGRRLYDRAFGTPRGRRMVNSALAGKGNGANLVDGFEQANLETLWRYLKLLEEIRGPRSFRGLKMPIDVLYGTRTFAGVRRSIPRWKAIWPHATFTEVSSAGHVPLADAPAALARLIFG